MMTVAHDEEGQAQRRTKGFRRMMVVLVIVVVLDK